MQCSKSPFTPTFRSVPPFLANREHILRDINRGFINGPGDPNLSTIFTGARGTGKTALLSLLSETALEHGWIAANVSAMPGMLEDIIERTKEAADSYLSQPHARINGVQIGPVGIDWTYAQEAQGNWRTRMNGVFRQLEKHDVGLLSKRPIGSFPIKTLSFYSRCCPILAPAGSQKLPSVWASPATMQANTSAASSRTASSESAGVVSLASTSPRSGNS